MPAPASEWTDSLIEEMITRMESGETITSIANDPRMPSAATMWRWEDKQDELGERITRARETGFISLAERARDQAQQCEDPQKGRLAFDADRWFLGKMCPKRFGDKLDLTSGGEKIKAERNHIEIYTRLAAASVKHQLALEDKRESEDGD